VRLSVGPWGLGRGPPLEGVRSGFEAASFAGFSGTLLLLLLVPQGREPPLRFKLRLPLLLEPVEAGALRGPPRRGQRGGLGLGQVTARLGCGRAEPRLGRGWRGLETRAGLGGAALLLELVDPASLVGLVAVLGCLERAERVLVVAVVGRLLLLLLVSQAAFLLGELCLEVFERP